MSIFASRTLQTIAIPFDTPNEVTIQKLAGRHLQKAATEKQVASREFVTRMGGQEFRKELAAISSDVTTQAAVAKAQADPLNAYDRYVLLEKGIKAWTYVDDQGKPVPVTPEAVDDLDEDAADFLARAILKLTKPALFETADEQATGKKTASAPLSLA